MNAKAIGWLVVLLTAGAVFGQSSGGTGTTGSIGSTSGTTSKKSALELALDEALKNNPDLRVSEAKAAEADAQLSRTRAQVIQKVVAAYQVLEKAKAAVTSATAELERATRTDKEKGGYNTDFAVAQSKLVQAKIDLAAAQSDLEYLTGKTRALRYRVLYSKFVGSVESVRVGGETAKPVEQHLKGPVADRLRKALEKKSTFAFNETNASDALDAIRKQAGDVHIQIADKRHAGWSEKLTAKLSDATVASALQLVEDATGHRVVIREYGLLIAPAEKLPPGAVPLAKFLDSKEEPPKTTTAMPKSGKK